MLGSIHFSLFWGRAGRTRGARESLPPGSGLPPRCRSSAARPCTWLQTCVGTRAHALRKISFRRTKLLPGKFVIISTVPQGSWAVIAPLLRPNYDCNNTSFKLRSRSKIQAICATRSTRQKLRWTPNVFHGKHWKVVFSFSGGVKHTRKGFLEAERIKHCSLVGVRLGRDQGLQRGSGVDQLWGEGGTAETIRARTDLTHQALKPHKRTE